MYIYYIYIHVCIHCYIAVAQIILKVSRVNTLANCLVSRKHKKIELNRTYLSKHGTGLAVKKRRKRIAAQNWTRNSKGSVFFRLLIKVIMKKQFDRGRLKQSLSATVVIFRKVFGQRYSAVTCLLQSKSQDFR